MHVAKREPTREATDPLAEIIRINMSKFREEASMSQAIAADLSGVPLDAIRRYESGVTANVPATVLKLLAEAYGRSIDDFMSIAPPPPKAAEDQRQIFLRTRPGVQIDADIMAELGDAVTRAHTKIRERKAKRKPTGR